MPPPPPHFPISIPEWAPVGPNWGPTWPNWGPTGAHMECCLGFCSRKTSIDPPPLPFYCPPQSLALGLTRRGGGSPRGAGSGGVDAGVSVSHSPPSSSLRGPKARMASTKSNIASSRTSLDMLEWRMSWNYESID